MSDEVRYEKEQFMSAMADIEDYTIHLDAKICNGDSVTQNDIRFIVDRLKEAAAARIE